MQKFKSVKEALNFAIAEEDKAAKFYAELAKKAEKPGLKKVFAGFVKEERKHKKKLMEVKKGKKLKADEKKVADLKIAEYTVDVEFGPGIDYQGALVIAMKKEKAAFKMYTDLAASTSKKSLKSLFLGLAQEEAKHKLHFEVEYEDFVMKEN